MSKPTVNRRSFLTGTASSAVAAGVLPHLAVASAKPPAPMYGPPAGTAKLNANENPFGPSPAALQAMQEAMQKGAYYVGESVLRLKAMIAERHGLTPDHIALSSGSSGVLTYAAQAAAKRGSIIGPDLFWDTTVRMALRQGGELKRLPKRADLMIDLDAMHQAIDPGTAMVQVTNPNNPTGLLLDAETLRAFCIKASKKCTVLMDEAYNELTADPEANSMIPLIKQGHDVMVARTFSKIYGLAGMRVGYLLASPERIEQVQQFALGDYSLNQAGVAAAVASYGDEAFLGFAKAKIIEAREQIAEAVKREGLNPLPSSTNFMFVNLGQKNAESFRQAMATQNVLIRGTYQDYHHWSRVSMGYPQDVAQYIAALPKALEMSGLAPPEPTA